jgi:hypothetical protein
MAGRTAPIKDSGCSGESAQIQIEAIHDLLLLRGS